MNNNDFNNYKEKILEEVVNFIDAVKDGALEVNKKGHYMLADKWDKKGLKDASEALKCFIDQKNV